MSTKPCEMMDYQDEENKPEKMEEDFNALPYEQGFSAQEILMDARRKLLKYQRRRGSTEDLMDCVINDTDQCPVCDCLVI